MTCPMRQLGRDCAKTETWSCWCQVLRPLPDSSMFPRKLSRSRLYVMKFQSDQRHPIQAVLTWPWPLNVRWNQSSTIWSSPLKPPQLLEVHFDSISLINIVRSIQCLETQNLRLKFSTSRDFISFRPAACRKGSFSRLLFFFPLGWLFPNPHSRMTVASDFSCLGWSGQEKERIGEQFG